MPFINECFRYRFADDPDYDKLERHLEKIILEMGDEEYNQLDWNEGYAVKHDSEIPAGNYNEVLSDEKDEEPMPKKKKKKKKDDKYNEDDAEGGELSA